MAHALLAEPYPHSLIGNLAGDLVKGRLHAHTLHPRVADGVRRHRRVDALTDSHSGYLSLRALFPGSHRRYAGIVLDVLFDHFLSLDWDQVSQLDRGEFIEGVYRVLTDNHGVLPPALASVAPHWVAADWLRVYESMEGVDAVLRRLSRRMSAPEHLVNAWGAVRDNPRPLRDGFLCVFAGVRTALDGL